MKKDDRIFVEHMLENIKDIESFIQGVSKEDFLSNKEKQNAVIRSIEVIGEAAKNIGSDLRDNNPSIMWFEIIGARDKMIHHYFGIDLNIIWDIAKINSPDLKIMLLNLNYI